MFAAILLAAATAPGQAAPHQAQLLSPAHVWALRDKLPATEDASLKKLYGKHLLFYTEEVMPRAYQHAGGFLDAYTNISAARQERFGNVNREFPWAHPAGTHRCGDVTKFNFVHLPAPITYWHSSLPRVIERSAERKLFLKTVPEHVVRWRYPDGTVFGEVLLLRDPEGVRRPFDLRTRTKVDGRWRVNAYRPFLTSEEYRTFLREEGVGDAHFKVSVGRLKNDHVDGLVIDRTAAVEELPAVPDDVVTRALSRPFRSALGTLWTTHDGAEGFAPTTKARYQIVPRNYDGGFVAVDSKSCMSCHEGAAVRQADDFDMARDWYGRLRGDDAIIGFHIAEPSSIAGYDPKRFVPRQALVKAGLLREK